VTPPARLALPLLLLATPACRDAGVDLSEDVGSSDMRVVLTVNAGEGQTTVRAQASALLPNSGAVVLSAGDRFVLHDDPTRVLAAEPGGVTQVTTTPRNRGRIAVDLLRTGDRSLIDLGIEVPPPFTLEPVAPRAPWSSPITLRWDRTEGTYTTAIVVEGACAKKLVRPLVSDTGEYLVNGGEIERLDPRSPCTVTVSVVRTAPYSGSRELYAQATQSRSVVVELLP